MNKKITLILLLMAVTSYYTVVSGQNAYIWIPTSGTADFQGAANWSPDRTSPASDDILNFINGGSSIATNIPTQTIGRFVVSNNTFISLKDVAGDADASTITISDGSGTDFTVDLGSTLTLDVASSNASTDALIITLTPDATGNVKGAINFANTNPGTAGRPHRLLAADAGAIVVTGTVTATDLRGNPFGSSGVDGVVIFESGSVYDAKSGANPFGDNSTNRVIFNTGSLYKYERTNAPSLAGRIYADVEFANTVNPFNGNTKMTSIDNLIIDAGSTVSFTPETLPITIQLKGNLTVNGRLDYEPENISAASTLSFVGSTQQQISIGGSGSLVLGSNLTVDVNNASGVLLDNDLTINGPLNLTDGALDINGRTLTVNGTETVINGTFTGSATSGLILGYPGTVGILKFTRNTPSTTANNYLDTLILRTNAKATIQDTINISGSDGLTPTPIVDYYGKTRGLVLVESGAILTTGASNVTKGLFILKSNEYGDAMVGQSAGIIADTVQIERYTFSRRAWRLYTAPFSASNQTINTAWQEGEHNLSAPLTCPTGDPAGEYGTWITYAGTVNGYDWNTTNNSSLYTWKDEDWIVPASTTGTNILAYKGYYLFNRGSRQQCIQYAVPGGSTPTTLRAKGILNQTSSSVIETFSVLNAQESILLSNPYASPIDFTNVNYSGINPNTFIVLDPDLTGTYGVGGFNTYSTVLPNTGWLINDPNSLYTDKGPVVQSGQAYFVHTTQQNGSATFTESDKVDDEFNVTGPFPFKAVPQEVKSALYAELRLTADNMSITDAAAVSFRKDFSKGEDLFDASKKWNAGEGLGIKGDSDWYAVDCRPIPMVTDTIFLGAYSLKQQQYTLQLYAINKLMDIPCLAWLVDTKWGSKIPLSITGDTTRYTFTADGNNATDKNRFMIVFRRVLIATPIPVTKVFSTQQTANTISNIATIEKSITLFPNPTTGSFVLNGADVGMDIVVMDITGRVLLRRKTSSKNERIDCSRFSNGLYFLNVISKDGHKKSLKFIKQK